MILFAAQIVDKLHEFPKPVATETRDNVSEEMLGLALVLLVG